MSTIFLPIAYFLFVGGLLDGYIVYVFLKLKYFRTASGEALLANLFSLLAGFISWPYIFPTGFDFADLSMVSYSLLWLITVLSEAMVIKVFNRSKSWKMILAACALMNLISFALMYGYFEMIN